MRLRKSKRGSEFADVLVFSICYNFRKRFEKRIRKPVKDRTDTWSTSLIRNRNKLRSVLVKPVRQAGRSSAWQHWITAKRDRLTQLMDPYHRWYRKEYRILEKVNQGQFDWDPCYHHGFTWTGVCAKQQTKVLQRRMTAPIESRVRRIHWSGCQARLKAEFSRLIESQPHCDNSPWAVVIQGAGRKLNLRMDAVTKWEARIVDSARRWSRKRGP